VPWLLGIKRKGELRPKLPLLHGGYDMELKELLAAARHIRPWVLLVFTLVAFQSLKNANPPEVTQPTTALVAMR
jgi:hypothetical protein